MLRTATLFSRTGASSPALGNNSYPSSLSAALSEEQVYHPGLHDLYPATVKVTRHAAGVTSQLKFQGTSDPPDLLLLGAGNAQISLYAVAPGLSVRLDQATGVSVATTHSSSGGLRVITLASDASGRPAETPASLHTYIAASLGADFVSAVVLSGGLMGATLRARDVPEAPRWVDIESTREDTGTMAAVHTVDPGAGASITLGFLVKTGGWRAIRCIATGTGAPNAADAVLVTMGLPG